MQELNAMNDLLDDWREEADFEIVAVSTDDVRSSSTAKSLANSNGWGRFTLLFDKNQELKRAMNVNMVPHTFIYDKNGKMVYSHVGYTPGTEEEYIKIIKSLK
jgi:peroxiredoxin